MSAAAVAVRKRSAAEKAMAFVRRLNEPGEPTTRRKNTKQVWPEPGAIEELFREARKQRA